MFTLGALGGSWVSVCPLCSCLSWAVADAGRCQGTVCPELWPVLRAPAPFPCQGLEWLRLQQRAALAA